MFFWGHKRLKVEKTLRWTEAKNGHFKEKSTYYRAANSALPILRDNKIF